MKTRRTIPALLVLASLAGLYATGCCWDPHYHRHGRRHLEVNIAVPSAVQMEAAAR